MQYSDVEGYENNEGIIFDTIEDIFADAKRILDQIEQIQTPEQSKPEPVDIADDDIVNELKDSSVDNIHAEKAGEHEETSVEFTKLRYKWHIAFFKWVTTSIMTGSQKINTSGEKDGLVELPPPPPEINVFT